MPPSTFFKVFALVLCLCPLAGMAGADAPPITPLVPVREGMHDVELKDLGNGEWEAHTTGSDPYLCLKTESGGIDLRAQPIFSFQYFSTAGIGRLLLFVGQVLDLPHLITVGNVSRSEGWADEAIDMTSTPQPAANPVKSVRLTLGERPGIVVRLRGFSARATNEQERRAVENRLERLERDRLHADRLLTYLRTQFPNQVTSVSADEKEIRIEGRTRKEDGELMLAEVPMWLDVTDLTQAASLRPIARDESGHFVCVVTRESIHDREPLLSAWAIVRKEEGGKYAPMSALHYADSVKARAELPPAKARPLKGIGGCPFDSPDMEKLEIASVTLNIVLNDFLATEPGPNRKPYTFAGRTWYVNEDRIAGYDRDMKLAAEHGWMVTAIILLQPPRGAGSNSWIADAAHPEAEPTGAYVMPNFTSREGVNAYAAAMNFITERYSRPDEKYGRAHHWILHNEISSGFYWTNAGPRKLVTYLDLYQKSMRVAYLLARQYDSHSKPFISLDHCWTRVLDPRAYAGKELLERLVDFSQKEGDFPWGIAYHPYAQDLRNPRTWEDSEVTFAFDTPYITFKNIEVLNAWAGLSKVAFRGQEPREIQLSEQGLNSPDYSEKSLVDQAAGLAYAWKKIEPLQTITAFQYHIWADHPDEGGLRLGLRKFANDPGAPHGIKPAWQLYEAIGTDHWESASSFAKPILGIKDWSEIPYHGKIE